MVCHIFNLLGKPAGSSGVICEGRGNYNENYENSFCCRETPKTVEESQGTTQSQTQLH